MKRKLKQMIEETADSCEEGFNKITMPLDEVEAVTKILKASLRLMIVKDWNGKDFKSMDQVEEMVNDIMNVLNEVGKQYTRENK
tara:strand:+ start:58 stop:309 length:252 start_codon:yes stop_codon:yes gene_type:complete